MACNKMQSSIRSFFSDDFQKNHKEAELKITMRWRMKLKKCKAGLCVLFIIVTTLNENDIESHLWV